jgi:hypothetical protein
MTIDADQNWVQPTRRFRRLGDIVDRSIAMFVFRRLTGRPTEVPDRRPFPPALSPDEVAYRLRLPGATTRPIVLPVATATVQPAMSPALVGTKRPAAKTRSGPRLRLIRDTGMALTGLATVVVVSFALWPSAQGGVLDAVASAGPYVAVAPSMQAPPAASPEAGLALVPAMSEPPGESPAVTSTPIPGETPEPSAGAAGNSTVVYRPPLASGPRPTVAPGHGPTPTPRPSVGPPTTPAPLPTFGPTPTPTPTPTPSPQPEPTSMPTPTPEPTPAPTPTPTPDPSPTPTPTPDPTPTP